MKSLKTIIAFPILASGLMLLSAGAAVFCVGCLIAEKLPNKRFIGENKQ